MAYFSIYYMEVTILCFHIHFLKTYLNIKILCESIMRKNHTVLWICFRLLRHTVSRIHLKHSVHHSLIYFPTSIPKFVIYHFFSCSGLVKSFTRVLFIYLFIYLTAPGACGSSWARDQTHTAVAACAAAVAMPDP